MDSVESAPIATADESPQLSRVALTSSASADWGSPEVVRRFAACVLRPAAKLGTAIDLDGASSSYWQDQWDARSRPAHYFDGSCPERDVLDAAAWDKLADIGAAFKNPPGDPTGELVQRCWATMTDRWFGYDGKVRATGRLDSLFWVGFSIEQLRSLQNTAARFHPLTRDDTVGTVLPGRRISYMVHPDAMIRLIEAKLTRKRAPAEEARMRKQIHELRTRASDAPVKGPSPTHASYMTVVWSHDRATRRRQQGAARDFLKGQAQAPGSPFQTYALVGAWGDR